MAFVPCGAQGEGDLDADKSISVLKSDGSDRPSKLEDSLGAYEQAMAIYCSELHLGWILDFCYSLNVGCGPSLCREISEVPICFKGMQQELGF